MARLVSTQPRGSHTSYMGAGGGFEPGPLGLQLALLQAACPPFHLLLSSSQAGGRAGLTPPGKPPRRGCRAHLSRVLKDKKLLSTE